MTFQRQPALRFYSAVRFDRGEVYWLKAYPNAAGKKGIVPGGFEAHPNQANMAASEIIFVVEEALEGGFVARALGASIFTEAETLAELRAKVRGAVDCHFDEALRPAVIRLHFVRDEVLPA